MLDYILYLTDNLDYVHESQLDWSVCLLCLRYFWWGGVQLGQPMDPLAQEPDRIDGWMDDKFIYMAHFIPKGNTECFIDSTSK